PCSTSRSSAAWRTAMRACWLRRSGARPERVRGVVSLARGGTGRRYQRALAAERIVLRSRPIQDATLRLVSSHPPETTPLRPPLSPSPSSATTQAFRGLALAFATSSIGFGAMAPFLVIWGHRDAGLAG